jgi:hypothetical protein
VADGRDGSIWTPFPPTIRIKKNVVFCVCRIKCRRFSQFFWTVLRFKLQSKLPGRYVYLSLLIRI